MFLFLKLVLAHLIGDFILQFEELYRLKVRSKWGHFFHAAIHAVMSLLLAFPYLSNPIVPVYLIALAVIHHFQDLIKYSIQARHPKQIFWCFTVDQIVHFLWIATCLLFPFSYEVKGFDNCSVLNQIYTDNTVTLVTIAFITSIFKGTYFLHALRRSFFPDSRPDHFITSFEVWHAMIERGWMTFWYLFYPLVPAVPFSGLIGFLRLPFPLLKNRRDFYFSWYYAAAVGCFFRYLLPKFS